MESILPFDDSQKIIFSQKEIAIPSDLRPMYKISLLLGMLKINGFKNKLSFLQIQYLNWLIKHQEKLANLNFSLDKLPFDVIRIDPFINTVIEYCMGEKLIILADNGKFEATNKAIVFINKLQNEKVLKDEFKILENIGKRKITDDAIKRMLEGN